jgi:hypothetical protein
LFCLSLRSPLCILLPSPPANRRLHRCRFNDCGCLRFVSPPPRPMPRLRSSKKPNQEPKGLTMRMVMTEGKGGGHDPMGLPPKSGIRKEIDGGFHSFQSQQ